MISYDRGIVSEIKEEDSQIAWLKVEINGNISNAVNYKDLTGDVEVGDSVVLNTTAVNLSLGTGGEHFVISNLSKNRRGLEKKGHIMKLRYTPMQTQVLAAEEEDSEAHDIINQFKNLDDSVFIVGTLHSMLAPIAAHLKWKRNDLKINYIMTDGGALPSSFSKNIKQLKSLNIIDNVITAGNAFGGDYEAVNIYTALIIAKEVLNSDITIVSMGPGIAGTGTKYGFSGVEQGYIVDAVKALGGKSVSVPRVSFGDKRERHKGISHHSLTIFTELTNNRTDLVLPELDDIERTVLESQVSNSGLENRHNIVYKKGTDVKAAMDHYGLNIKTMGRGYDQDEAFFLTLGAAAEHSLELIHKKESEESKGVISDISDSEDTSKSHTILNKLDKHEQSERSKSPDNDFLERVISSRVIFEGKILNLRLDDVELRDGSYSKREIIEHKGAVAIVALTPEKEILMVRQYRSAIGKEILEIPAGLIEEGEDPKRTALRELEEETGYIANRIEKIHSYYSSAGFSDEVIHIYFATDLSIGRMNLDDGEFLEVEKWDIDDLDRLIEESSDAKTLIGLQYLSNQIKNGNTSF